MVSQRLLEALVPLYYVYLSKGLLKGRTRLQKLVFLFQMKSRVPVDYQYKKGDYGPFSYKLYMILDNLISMGLLSERREITVAGNEMVSYEITKSGKSLVTFACKKEMLSANVQEILEQIFKKYGTLSLTALIAKVYQEYPEWAEKSIFVFP